MGAAAAAGIGIGVALGYAWGAFSVAPRMTEVTVRPCAIPTHNVSFALSLDAVAGTPDAPGIRVGPLDTEGTPAVLFLQFHPDLDDTAGEVVMQGTTLRLPGRFGRDWQRPRRIVVNCRDGLFATAVYESISGERREFAVLAGSPGTDLEERYPPAVK